VPRFSKDLAKLTREGFDGLWLHALDGCDAGTFPRAFSKTTKASEGAIQQLPSMPPPEPRSFIFAFCVLRGAKGKMLLIRSVAFAVPADESGNDLGEGEHKAGEITTHARPGEETLNLAVCSGSGTAAHAALPGLPQTVLDPGRPPARKRKPSWPR